MIADNVAQVQAEITAACARVGRDPAEVCLIAVSKTKPVTDILEAMEAGVQHFGENRVEEATGKISVVAAQSAAPPTWHMIGHIQSRKAQNIPPLFQVVHSIDSVRLAEKLARILENTNARLDVLVQINISGEGSKGGLEANDWQKDTAIQARLWEEVRAILTLPQLQVRGLMTMAPLVSNPEQTRPVFAAMSALRARLADSFGVALPDLSMGMTNDYAVAIEEGATMVRIGRAIFGERET